METFCEKILIISIHTPLAGSDSSKVKFFGFIIISIHTPLAGSDRAQVGI